ncbi:E3 ubiquitin-protein ligase NRDP1-like protein [Dinothrombium tinctorium]|uniref:E3 ubiquitin-protein ligase NRDP1-like protein n=1 Tax=Dinothrombium tinctorium TaxID=1965070 RepID=A0A3S3P683_9ACAR|nr:E3 ubiquitin-protein ligase NRDP1-like protein [Dinothrombium tinctorium]RWS15801.1 E3 ubiquitin-protein ligase NRDP1-like protein [Dinothrombium tinctorium]RWS16749.1 E3 ubiquitin-protein ligase NRDP1-like protein [Dinothrombium tinctorium]
MPGYDTERFISKVNEEFVCSICLAVLKNPICDACEHYFCEECIHSWLGATSRRLRKCPLSNEEISINTLKPVPRIVRNLLGRLELKCAFDGCEKIVTYNEIDHHETNCTFNPENNVQCEKNCGATLKISEIGDHDCVKYLQLIVAELTEKVDILKAINESNRIEINETRKLCSATIQEVNRLLPMLTKELSAVKNELSEIRRNLGPVTQDKEKSVDMKRQSSIKDKVEYYERAGKSD